jgi:hypothetical protein
LLLALGAGAGLVAAGGSLLVGGERLGPGTVARVNHVEIRGEDHERAVAALAADRRTPPGPAERRRVLDRLVDEELLVQRGLALGLARHDRQVRAHLTQAVIAGVVAEARALAPTDAELLAFLEAHRGLFTQPGRLRVRQVFCRAPGPAEDAATLARAGEAARRLRAGEAPAQVESMMGDPPPVPLPDALLAPAKLEQYLGPTALAAALGLATGAISDPVRSASGYHVLQLVERHADASPPLAEIRAQVVAEYRRRAGERALRAYLGELRARADVVVADLP